jgi:hypothetical protein
MAVPVPVALEALEARLREVHTPIAQVELYHTMTLERRRMRFFLFFYLY